MTFDNIDFPNVIELLVRLVKKTKRFILMTIIDVKFENLFFYARKIDVQRKVVKKKSNEKNK